MAPPGLALPAPIYNCAYLEILFLSSSSSPRMASLHFLLPPAPRCIALSELHTSTALALSGSQSKSSVGRCVDDIPCDCRYDRRIDDVSEGSTGDGCCFTLSWEVHKNRGVNCIPDDIIALQAGQAPRGPSNGNKAHVHEVLGHPVMQGEVPSLMGPAAQSPPSSSPPPPRYTESPPHSAQLTQNMAVSSWPMPPPPQRSQAHSK